MTFTGILSLGAKSDSGNRRAAFFQDLNLDQVVDRITKDLKPSWKRYFYNLPASKEDEDYRRAFYQDYKNEAIHEFFLKFISAMVAREELISNRTKVDNEYQKSMWLINEISYYCSAVEALHNAVALPEIKSTACKSLKLWLQTYYSSPFYAELDKSCKNLREQVNEIKLRLNYTPEKIAVFETTETAEYEERLNKVFPEHKAELKNPFQGELFLMDLEEEIIKIYKKKKPELFNEMKAFSSKFANYADENILKIREEVMYYESFYRFESYMIKNGFSFCVPTVSEEKCFQAKGLYDLALAMVNVAENKKVVSNDMDLQPSERFFVLTGPNQGGKTTFARSLGQLVYFTKMGFDVPAISANVPYFQTILTHFSVEESLETGRGKLKEELLRLAPMMDNDCDNCFVVINELFTTAANYDACIMGKNVLNHFIAKNCRGIYVTHLKDLSTCHEQIVSITASLDENKKQNFLIRRNPAEDIAYAINQVNKYRLTYDQINERFQNKEA